MIVVRTLLLASMSSLMACAPVAPRASVADADPLRKAVVDDVTRVLDAIELPKTMVLIPVRRTASAFDVALVASLRAAGRRMGDDSSSGSRFDARVLPVEGTMYRVTVLVGTVTLSRLWVLDGANAYAGGAWARRE